MSAIRKFYKQLKGAGKSFTDFRKRVFRYRPTMRKRMAQLKGHGFEIKELSRDQKASIKAIYKGEHFLYEGHQFYWTVNGKFDPWLFPEDLFRTKYEAKLNDQNWVNVCYEKAYFERFMPDVPFPKTMVRSVEGFLYDQDFNLITLDKAKEILSSYDEVVFKPSDKWCGQGVHLAKPSELDLENSGNYVIQERIHQHEVLRSLNESSVNIVRVNTLIKGTEVIPLSACLRVGGKGEFTDNYSTPDGLGMIVIGIDENGCLRENGYYSCALPAKTNHSGIPFKGLKIPNFDKMVEIAVKNHPMIPKIRFIGWDITLDEEGNPVVIEINPKFPGVFYYQLANGPLFGERSEEIYKWLKTL